MEFTARITGGKDIHDRIARAIVEVPQQIGRGLFEEAEIVMGISKRDYCPVETGTMRDTGYVSPPQVANGSARVELGYGGPSAPYALRQHEDLELHHDHGEAKFLEKPLNQRAPQILANVAARVDLKD